MNYELIEENDTKVIKKIDADGTVYWIPLDEGNSDYQRYLRWLNGEDRDGTLS